MKKLILILLSVTAIFSLGININAKTKTHSDKNLEGIGFRKISIISDDYKLYQNFPNPFNPATIISYKLNQSGYVTLKDLLQIRQQIWLQFFSRMQSVL